MTPYAGDKPKEDLDTAWEALLKPMNMRFSENELRSTNQASVSLPEEGGYLGWFGVFHSLHCVVSLSWHICVCNLKVLTDWFVENASTLV